MTPYKFLKCDFTCHKNFELSTHHLSFEMEKPYKCSKFEFSFLQKEELGIHITSVHDLEKPFNCSKCDFSFLQKEGLSTHTYHLSA